MFEYFVYSCVKKTEPDLSIPVRGQEVMRTNLPYRKFSVNIRVYFFSCEGGQSDTGSLSREVVESST